jgi:hypothetical protein
MKKKYREQALSELFRELQHKDFDIRENAMFQLGLMLERSNQGAQMVDAGDIYEDNLSRELLRMKLDDDEQNQVVDVLSQVVAMQKESRPTAFWAIGKVKPSVGISPLLGLIRATGHQLNTEAAYQACDALKRWLSAGVGDDETVSAQLKLQDPTDIIRRWYDSSDDRLVDAADGVLDLLG